MQKTIENGVTILTADENMMLTDGSTFGTVVYLGVQADETVWREVTKEEVKSLFDHYDADHIE